jgi:trimeric autotransporter adhesin
MIVWGGSFITGTGGRYNPETNTWIDTAAGPSGRTEHTAVWTGSEMLVYGGTVSGGRSTNTGGRYNPANNTWINTTTIVTPSLRSSETGVWTGNELIIWGGTGDNTGSRYSFAPPLTLSQPTQSFTATGGTGSVAVTAQGGCTWMATSNSSFITITSGSSGAGNGTVNFSVAANTSQSARTGTLTIGTQTFTVTQSGENPLPTLNSLNPASASGGGSAFTLTVTGTGFVTGATVRWNGANRTTTFVSNTQMTAQIPASDLMTLGPATITVFNPAPGGGTSNALNFNVTASVSSISAASFSGTELAANSIVAALGSDLATQTLTAPITPLPTTLAGTTVRVRDSAGMERLAPLFFVSPTQVNYIMPAGTATGAATVTITSGSGKLSLGAVQIAAVAPGLFAANANGQGVAAAVVLRVRGDGSQSFEPVAQFDATTGRFVSTPIDLGPATDQVFLILFGTGFRAASSLNNVAVRIGGASAEVLFAGAQGDLAGLDQSNVRVPRSLAGRSEVDVVLTVDGKAANTVRVSIK